MVSSEHRDCCLRYADLGNLFTLYILTAGNCGCGVVSLGGDSVSSSFPDYIAASQKEEALYREEESCLFPLGPQEPARSFSSR